MDESHEFPMPSQEKERSLETRYPGIFGLKIMPEVMAMTHTAHLDGSFDLTVKSADGYRLDYTLRPPCSTDFAANPHLVKEAQDTNRLVIAAMHLIHPAETIDIISHLHTAEQKIAGKLKNTYAIEASAAPHLGRIPPEYLNKSSYNPDSTDQNSQAADIVRTSLMLDIAKFDESAESARIRLPVGDLTLHAFLHEVDHSLDLEYMNNPDRRYPGNGRLEPIYKILDPIEQEVELLEKELIDMTTEAEELELENPESEKLDLLYTSLFDKKDRQDKLGAQASDVREYVHREANIISERNAHAPALAIEKHFIKRHAMSPARLQRIQSFQNYVLYTYQKELELKRSRRKLTKIPQEYGEHDFVYIPPEKRDYFENIETKYKAIVKNK